MDNLVRFGVSMPEQLLVKFDSIIKLKGYTNRSEAIRDMVRDAIVEHKWMEGKEVMGVITIVYDHGRKGLMEKLTDLQHHHHHNVASTTHIHLDHDNCLEVVVVKGKTPEVTELADNMIALKGVKHGKLVVTSALSGE
ncbi:MAG: nickel-responsive transcriptional regulator NikR [Candidatus Thorarchaeota archaeon]|jgi:CopG family nickel-responsive transcriptional regulator